MEWIEEMAKEIALSQSFEYGTFEEAKKRIDHEDKYYIYDRLSLCFYEYNLKQDELRLLFQYIKQKYNYRSNEYEKMRMEYAILFQYSCFHPHFRDCIIAKSIRPDFLIKANHSTIAVEVTQLTTQYEKVMEDIANLSFGKSMTAEELWALAKSKHKNKADQYRYYEFSNTVAVGSELATNIAGPRKDFVSQITGKYNKYESLIDGYGEFIVLCNAQAGLEITQQWEADEVLFQVSGYPFKKTFHVAILWLNESAVLQCSERLMEPNRL